jgi:hypothetical protein
MSAGRIGPDEGSCEKPEDLLQEQLGCRVHRDVLLAGHDDLALRPSMTRAHRVWSADIPCTRTNGGPCPAM